MSIRNNRFRLFLSLLFAPQMEFRSEEAKNDFEEIRKTSPLPESRKVLDFTVFWARLMQKEFHDNRIDLDSIRRCELLAGCIVREDEYDCCIAKGLLEDYWKYGDLLKKLS